MSKKKFISVNVSLRRSLPENKNFSPSQLAVFRDLGIATTEDYYEKANIKVGQIVGFYQNEGYTTIETVSSVFNVEESYEEVKRKVYGRSKSSKKQ